MDEHELMYEFNKNFQVYTDVRFLKFNIEKCLNSTVRTLDVYLSKSVPLIYKKYRYLVPIAVAINGIKRTDIKSLKDILGFIPLFKMTCNEDVLMMNLDTKKKNYKLLGADDFKSISRDLVKEFNVEFNNNGSDESKLKPVKDELERMGVKYTDKGNVLEIYGQQMVVTSMSTFLLPDKYARDYTVIAPDVRYLYKMRLHNNEQGNRLISIGFITRKDNEDIVIHPEDYRVVINNNQIEEI